MGTSALLRALWPVLSHFHLSLVKVLKPQLVTLERKLFLCRGSMPAHLILLIVGRAIERAGRCTDC